MSILHKYARRLVRWLNTPSEEECRAEKRAWDAYKARRERIANEVARWLAHPPLPSTYYGRSTTELFEVKNHIERLAKTGAYSDKIVAAHEEQLKKAFNTSLNPSQWQPIS